MLSHAYKVKGEDNCLYDLRCDMWKPLRMALMVAVNFGCATLRKVEQSFMCTFYTLLWALACWVALVRLYAGLE
ncbi:hypothetical protein MtrunA17_Chr5g0426071 [Medicago truncatula]|uniref:Transmembrane protein n=1 Tax=Medicago truncatula TaxID=3880 RepID=A2Q6D1_MEDTR|nr:hypothetical protein MtrDRAFT_AC174468g16v1 [Medicago truncatula]RHN56130.1 hypothetical protein MtrunA17_Chr5g0426071 [Medicago truncatula]